MSDTSSDDDAELGQALMLDNDAAYQSSSPSIQEDEIDFQYVYALRTFTATEQGQANAVKGDAMVLLNDTNSYWWLVRLVKDSTVGFLPAEHVETPSERLARLNKHRNSEFVSPAMFSFDSASNVGGLNTMGHGDGAGSHGDGTGNHGSKRMKRRGAKKSVTFTQTLTFVSASENEYSDEGEDADVEDIGEFDSEEEEEEGEGGDKSGDNSVDNSTTHSTTHSTMTPLVIRKPRSLQSLRSEQADFNTNSDEDSSSNGHADKPGLLVSKRTGSHNNISNILAGNSSNSNNTTTTRNRSNSTNSSISTGTSLFSRISKSVNRRHSSIPSPTRGQDGNNSSTITTSDDMKSIKRRSLNKTKSSTEHLKKGPSSSIESTFTPHDNNSNNSNTSNSIAGLFKRNQRGPSNTQIPQAVRRPDLQSSMTTSSNASVDTIHNQQQNAFSVPSTSSINSSSDTSDRDNRSGSAATMSTMSTVSTMETVPSSPSLDDSGEDEDGGVGKGRNGDEHCDQLIAGSEDISHSTGSPGLPNQYIGLDTGLSTPCKNNVLISVDSGISDGNSNGNNNIRHSPISQSSSIATVSALASTSTPTSTSTSTSNPSWITNLPTTLHPEILPIYKETATKLDRMSSRIDAILLKYSRSAAPASLV